jgi:hypothetical protein
MLTVIKIGNKIIDCSLGGKIILFSLVDETRDARVRTQSLTHMGKCSPTEPHPSRVSFMQTETCCESINSDRCVVSAPVPRGYDMFLPLPNI